MDGQGSRILAMFLLCGVVVGCGGGGGGGSSYPPVPVPTAGSTATPSSTATPMLSPAPLPTTSTQIVNAGAAPVSATFSAIAGGISGTATLPTTISGSSSITATFGSALPGGLPTVSSAARMPRAIGVTLTPIAFFTFSASNSVSFATSPAFSLTGPLSSTGVYYVGVYDPTNGWTLLTGPATFTGTLSLPALSRSTTFATGTTTSFVIFSTVAPIPTPTPTPTPTPSAVPAGSYWVVGSYGPGATFVSTTGSGSSTLTTAVNPIPGSHSAPLTIQFDSTGAAYLLLYTLNSVPSTTGTFAPAPINLSGEVIQVFAPRATGTAAPVRMVTVPNYTNNIVVRPDGSIFVSYNGTVSLLPASATSYAQAAPYANLWTYSESNTLLPADGPLALGPDGTLYCTCRSLPTNLGGGFGLFTVSSYAPGMGPANTAPSTIATVDPTSIYGPRTVASGAPYPGRSVYMNGVLYFISDVAQTNPPNPTTPLGGAIFGVTVKAQGAAVPVYAITGLSGANASPFDFFSDGTNFEVTANGSLEVFSPSQSGAAIPLSTNSAAALALGFVQY